MSLKKAIIADDEAASRSLIREYLQQQSDFTVVAECCNGIEAIDVINSSEADVVFLDIQMPGLNGIEVLGKIDLVPRVVFTTAFDRYAIKAFELNALDYLLKPYTRRRFEETLNRVRSNVQTGDLVSFVERFAPPDVYPERLLLSHGNKLIGIPVAEIVYLKADRDYAQVNTNGNRYLSAQGIGAIERRLDPNLFVRIHRSYIVNICYIREVYREITRMFLVLENGTELTISRNYADNVKKLIL